MIGKKICISIIFNQIDQLVIGVANLTITRKRNKIADVIYILVDKNSTQILQ
ncbi:Uncharacterised protein [Mycoplasma putrefaciens]|nr:Uncharacterised protein [Mycoplasma putrefaciens]